MTPQRRYTVREAAAIAGVSPGRFRSLVRAGTVRSGKVDPFNPKSHYRISEAQLNAYLNREA